MLFSGWRVNVYETLVSCEDIIHDWVVSYSTRHTSLTTCTAQTKRISFWLYFLVLSAFEIASPDSSYGVRFRTYRSA